MSRKKKQAPKEYGEMYQDFLTSPDLKLKKEKESFYVKFCKTAGKFVKAPNTFKDEKYKSAYEFLELPLTPSQVNAAPSYALMLSMIVVVPVIAYLLFLVFIDRTMELISLMYLLPISFLIPFLAVWYFQNYPLGEAENQRLQSITQIPEIINYMVMSMKLTPNLERAVEFAAEHGSGKIANDLKDIVIKVRIGKYDTMEEGLDILAYKWSKFSDEFKHALMLVRSSVIEVDDAKRHILLDKAASDVLEGISNDMESYVIKMRQPSIYMYYLGVLLPLLLIIILPVGSVLGNLPLAQTWLLILLYNIGLPIGTIYFARNILKKRPPVYTPPTIPDNFPGLPRKNHLKIGKMTLPSVVVAIAAAITIFALFSLVIEPLVNPYPEAYMGEDAIAAWVPMMAITGAVVGVATAIAIWLFANASYKRKEQLRLMEMESEFKDSIYIVASRLGEGKPIEEAFGYTAEFMKGTQIATVFAKVSTNINNLGMTVDTALFDSVYGALRYVPSKSIKNSMRILIDSIQLGVQQGSKALIGLSLQLADAEKIKKKVKDLLSEITIMMTTIAFFVGPIVLGITTALQKIVISSLSSLSGVSSMGGSQAYMTDLPLISFGAEEALAGIPSPPVFLCIIAIYVLEVTLILTYFTSRIQEGNNDLSLKMAIASSLPISMLLFFISAFVASTFASVV